MPAINQRKVRFSEPWDDDDIIPDRMEISYTCKLHEDYVTTKLWKLDQKKIRMLKSLHADDADVLARHAHRVNRDHALQLPYNGQDSEMATDHQAVYGIEMESAKMRDNRWSPDIAGEGRSEWDQISATVRGRDEPPTFNMCWGDSSHKDTQEHSQPPAVPKFDMCWTPATDTAPKPPAANSGRQETHAPTMPKFDMCWTPAADDACKPPAAESGGQETQSATIPNFDMCWAPTANSASQQTHSPTADNAHKPPTANSGGQETHSPTIPNFDMCWAPPANSASQQTHPPTADDNRYHSMPPPMPNFDMCWTSAADKDESVQPLVEDNRKYNDDDREQRVPDLESVRPQDVWKKLPESGKDLVAKIEDITSDTSGDPCFSTQLELETYLQPFHPSPTPDREASGTSAETAAPYVVRRKQLTLNTCWGKGAADADNHEESEIPSGCVDRALAAVENAKRKVEQAIAQLEDDKGRSSPTIDKKREELLNWMLKLEIGFNSVPVQQKLANWLDPPTFVQKSFT